MADLNFVAPSPANSADGGVAGPGAPAAGGNNDPTLVTGQDPDSFAGIPYSYSTGAPGSAAPGGEPLNDHSVNQPNQYPGTEPISGVTLDETGAPGTQGAPDMPPASGEHFLVSDPNYTSGRPGGGSGVQMIGVDIDTSGPHDSTMVQGQYPPAAPIIPGDFYPVNDGAGSGNVLVGGFKKGARP